MRPHCGQHAGPCPTAETPEGTWCTITGYELRGPQLVCYDMRQCCNQVAARVPTADRPRRAAASLQRAARANLSPRKWHAALRSLYPHLTAAESAAWSASIAAWSAALRIHRDTHPSLRTWALLFTATVTSKLASGGALAADHAVLLPPSPTFPELPHASYPKRGISCRSMSTTWRSVLTAALTPTGEIATPFVPPTVYAN